MHKFLWSMFFVLVIATGSPSAQTRSQGGSEHENHLAQTAQPSTGASTPSGSLGSKQTNNPSANAPATAGNTSGGGAGAASSAAGTLQLPETPQTPSAAATPSDSDLQSQVQNALSKEPTLSGDNVNVAVSADSIDITGSVATAREKQIATRIVQSYAGNKKVLSHLTITGRNRTVSPTGRPSQANP